MRVDGVADHLSDELVDQDDADVTASQEAPAGRNRKLAALNGTLWKMKARPLASGGSRQPVRRMSRTPAGGARGKLPAISGNIPFKANQVTMVTA